MYDIFWLRKVLITRQASSLTSRRVVKAVLLNAVSAENMPGMTLAQSRADGYELDLRTGGHKCFVTKLLATVAIMGVVAAQQTVHVEVLVL